jgi:hypothetical protein
MRLRVRLRCHHTLVRLMRSRRMTIERLVLDEYLRAVFEAERCSLQQQLLVYRRIGH